ncbi:hypothetical protein XW81_00340 [Buchnera aphidicola (Schlechtendalia chinensis)]|uniref:Flagellar motor switch protein FliG n=1 Tax=Buchnera aphidicola subsp. Schlechtendalia chinensis TaxID=118110 RepID=A0A172WD42_BUCSC|nr:FliG C-terminal domain-containing protein [Buchnera aphidicola]ANF16883.1 hypothetical protein XW81_00340 [Buchnera aphidicola (Schlechtendalia chinensis)]
MMHLDGIKKSAILLITIGIDRATEVLKELSFLEIQDLIACMLNLSKIPSSYVDQVISEYDNYVSLDNSSIAMVNKNYVVSLSKKVLGDEIANNFLNEVKDNKDIFYGIEQLNKISPKNIFYLIKNEHPQVIATILIYLDRSKVVEILSFFEDRLELEIISRIANFTSLQKSGKKEFIKIINDLLKKNKEVSFKKNGIKTVIELLKLMTYDREKHIIGRIEKFNQKLANIIKSESFIFENIVNLDDSYIKRLIKETTLDELSIAITSSSALLKEKIFKNLSKKDSDYVRGLFPKNSSISEDIVREKRNNLLIIVKSFL